MTLRFESHEDAEEAINALLAALPALIVNASKSAHQAWLDGHAPLVTEDTVHQELLRIISALYEETTL